MTDGTKIAYVKRYIEKADQTTEQKIKKAETSVQNQLNQPSANSISQSAEKSTASAKKVSESARKSTSHGAKLAEVGVEESIGKLEEGKIESVMGRDAKAGARRIRY